MKVCVITHSPSPYQVELFDAVVRRGEMELDVVYLYPHDPQRLWAREAPAHRHAYYEAEQTEELVQRALAADLLVVNYFKHPLADQLIRARALQKAPWAFWGERPRRHALELVSRLYRGWRLRELHRSRAAIWGIGEMAVEAYRAEFGDGRRYVNLPYFSDLERFEVQGRVVRETHERVMLFSGSLIPRKGVDLVARVFARLAQEGLRMKLRIMGSGELEAALKETLSSCLEQVEFLGFKDWRELPAAYAAADVLCVPSRYDGWGLVVPEGLAAGLPVISTTQTGAAKEFIKTGSNGWLIAPGDEAALYSAMREAATATPERLAAMARAAEVSMRDHHLDAGARRFAEAAMQAVRS
jgi:glycosyltransferase involved in cell wall biosynthesis